MFLSVLSSDLVRNSCLVRLRKGPRLPSAGLTLVNRLAWCHPAPGWGAGGPADHRAESPGGGSLRKARGSGGVGSSAGGDAVPKGVRFREEDLGVEKALLLVLGTEGTLLS